MIPETLVDQLALHRTVGKAPRHELEWLVAHGTLRRYEVGDVLSARDARVDHMYVVLSGRVGMFVERGGSVHKVLEWREGDVAGVLPYSRLVSAPGNAIVQDAAVMLAVPREVLPALTRECYAVTDALVHVMLDRARTFTSSDLLDEKLRSLGKLSAGLAHELNNPVAAIERGAARLENRLEEAERAARVLGAAHLTDAQLEALDAIRAACVAGVAPGVRSPLEEAAREEAIADWLATHGLDEGLADALAETAVTIEALDQVAVAVEGPALEAVLRWAASGCAVRILASEIQEAATRVSGLVMAIKGFTHMDQALVAEPIDLGQGLSNTVAVLRAKARGKSASVTVSVAPGLPRVLGVVGELNQVWANLIDNALDAIPQGGRVDVVACRDGTRVVVRIVDDGPGIPREIRDRIFDPFFTTKPVGQGTGLGLDIVRRLIRHNEGDIEVESQPGRTEFRVSLPLAGNGPSQ